jgi:hypothetical protein
MECGYHFSLVLTRDHDLHGAAQPHIVLYNSSIASAALEYSFFLITITIIYHHSHDGFGFGLKLNK